MTVCKRDMPRSSLSPKRKPKDKGIPPAPPFSCHPGGQHHLPLSKKAVSTSTKVSYPIDGINSFICIRNSIIHPPVPHALTDQKFILFLAFSADPPLTSLNLSTSHLLSIRLPPELPSPLRSSISNPHQLSPSPS